MNNKKITALFISAVVLLTALCGVSVSAAENPTFTVVSQSGFAGEIIEVPVTVTNNPGILGAELIVTFDEKLTLLGAKNGKAFLPLTMTDPGELKSSCKYMWDGLEIKPEDVCDGTIVTFSFKISDSAAAGSALGINLSYENGCIVDNDLKSVNVSITSGSVTVLTPTSEAKAVFTFGNISGKAGDTVSVPLTLASTEKINSIGLSGITYDKDNLEFLGFSDYEEIEELAMFDPTFDIEKMAIVIALSRSQAYSGSICNLNFKIKEDTEDGIYSVNAAPLVKNDTTVYTSTVVPGKITVFSQKLGDIDGNEEVDINDAILLFQYSMFPDLYPIEYKGSVDYTKDGAVDINDAILLFQYSMFPDLYPIQ